MEGGEGVMSNLKSELSEDEKRFLIGLEDLTRRTGIVIGGCGCCDSPFLSKVDSLPIEAGYGCLRGGSDEVHWISPSNKFCWEKYSEAVVKVMDLTNED